MYTGESDLFRGTNTGIKEVIHFIFNTRKGSNGIHQAVVVDKDFEILTNKVLSFKSMEEFFALADYMLRNGIVVSD